MRIVHVVTRSDVVSGVQVYIRDLSQALMSHGHEVLVMSAGDGRFSCDLAERHIPFRPIKHLVAPVDPWRDVSALVRLRRALRQVRPDLVVLHSSKAGFLGRIAACTLRIPAIFVVHGWAFTDGIPERRAGLYRVVERAMSGLAARIITVSEHDRQLAIRKRVAGASRMVAIHNSVPDIPSIPLAEPEAPVVRLVMVARFEPQKDHATLLRALSMIAEDRWVLDLVGDGDRLPDIRNLAEQLGIATKVNFLGFCDNVAQRLADSQVSVLASRWEGLPISIIEAMRAGLPVVASDVGGIRELVSDGQTGFLVPKEDPESLARQLSLLSRDPGLRKRLGRAGRERYESCFAFERMYRETFKVYTEVLSGSGLRRGSDKPA